LKAAASERECVLSVAFNSASFLSESDVSAPELARLSMEPALII
jgi:hypothetical protein